MFKNLGRRALGSGAAFVVLWGVSSSPIPLAEQAHGALMTALHPDYKAEDIRAVLVSAKRLAHGLWSDAPRLRSELVSGPGPKARGDVATAPRFSTAASAGPGWATEGDALPLDDESPEAVTPEAVSHPEAGLVSPLHGIITGGFGQRLSPIDGESEVHEGVDIAASPGATVVASLSGVVSLAGPAGTLGNAVIIDHPEGKRTRYGHLSKVMVTVGEAVVAGQTIGTVGSTGAATGPHLHFEFLDQGKPVDPRAAFAWGSNRT